MQARDPLAAAPYNPQFVLLRNYRTFPWRWYETGVFTREPTPTIAAWVYFKSERQQNNTKRNNNWNWKWRKFRTWRKTDFFSCCYKNLSDEDMRFDYVWVFFFPALFFNLCRFVTISRHDSFVIANLPPYNWKDDNVVDTELNYLG